MNIQRFKDAIGVLNSFGITLSKDSSLNSEFKKASLVFHPDKGGSKDDFLKVKDAFDVLKSSSTWVLVFEEKDQYNLCFKGSLFNVIIKN